MKPQNTEWLIWIPRVLAILFAVFISMFALDVFQTEKNLGQLIFDLFMHLMPTFIILIILILFWKKEWMIGIAFVLLSLIYGYIARDFLPWILAISGPLFLTGVLYLAIWFYRNRHHT